MLAKYDKLCAIFDITNLQKGIRDNVYRKGNKKNIILFLSKMHKFDAAFSTKKK